MGEEILRQFGYASGVYLNNCGLCEETFTGDRRSVVCESLGHILATQLTRHTSIRQNASFPRIIAHTKPRVKQSLS